MVNRVTVLGSLNVDNIMQVKRLPLPGETMTMSAKKLQEEARGLTKRSQLLVLVPKPPLSVK